MVSDHVHLRPMLPKEWPDFKAKRLEALQATPNVFVSTYAENITKPDEWWMEMLAGEKEKIFGLFDGKKLVGITGVFTSWLDPSEKTAFLGMSYIDPDYRGRGYSALFYESRLAWAREKGFEKAFVSHHIENEASKAANQKHGFRHIGNVEKQFPDGMGISCEYELLF